jgi:hypothetical protein
MNKQTQSLLETAWLDAVKGKSPVKAYVQSKVYRVVPFDSPISVPYWIVFPSGESHYCTAEVSVPF